MAPTGMISLRSKSGDVLDDTDLPAALTEGWTEDEGNEGQPFPPCRSSNDEHKMSQSHSRWDN
jgi:hypothetical protein